MPTTLRSHAKINLGLYIGAPRVDGFHSLVTVYQTLDLHDLVSVSARPAAFTTIRLSSNDERVPLDGRNTAWKMVELALEAMGLCADVSIHIEKRLPVQGGLGAGSGNAVAALVGLEHELGTEICGFPPFEQKALEGWGTRAEDGAPKNAGPSNPLRSAQDDSSIVRSDQDDNATVRSARDDNSIVRPARDYGSDWAARRMEISARVGSDVPLFLIGGTVLGVDRGQEVRPLPDIEPLWCVVAVPALAVSTPQAFRDWDVLCAEQGLTPEASDAKLKELSHAYASAFAKAEVGQAGSSGVLSHGEDFAGPQESALIRTGITSWIENDFERVVFRQHPSLAEIKRILAANSQPEAALHASLSGSGSALYGLYKTRGDAEAAQVRLAGEFRETEVRSVLTRTLPRQAYWAGMLQDFEH
jgi:4-diphosphocytidyl-2-C-methyl-D-erythritol kinase